VEINYQCKIIIAVSFSVQYLYLISSRKYSLPAILSMPIVR